LKGENENKIKVTKSSGNVFADIGLPTLRARHQADLVIAIALDQIEGPDPSQAASLLGLAQPDVSKLAGHLSGTLSNVCSANLNALGEKVRIEVSEAKTKTKPGSNWKCQVKGSGSTPTRHSFAFSFAPRMRRTGNKMFYLAVAR